MFIINEDKSIYATRGDIVFFSVSATDEDGVHEFQAGDVVTLKIFGKKDAENIVLKKDFPVLTASQTVDIYLDRGDMKIGKVSSKPIDYWYEIVLNDDTEPQTFIGYDEDGAKLFRLLPEGADVPPYEPEPEDIPVVDEELDLTSPRPVQNQAIARAITVLEGKVVDSDWNASEGEAGYVQNRTHYEDADGTVHKLDKKFLPDDVGGKSVGVFVESYSTGSLIGSASITSSVLYPYANMLVIEGRGASIGADDGVGDEYIIVTSSDLTQGGYSVVSGILQASANGNEKATIVGRATKTAIAPSGVTLYNLGTEEVGERGGNDPFVLTLYLVPTNT